MKVVYSYFCNVSNVAVSVENFIAINRQLEALHYLQHLMFNANIGNLFKDSIEAAICNVIYDDDIDVSVDTFYRDLEANILVDIDAKLGLEYGVSRYETLHNIKWWKVITTIPDENDSGFPTTATATVVEIEDVAKECQCLLSDIEPNSQR